MQPQHILNTDNSSGIKLLISTSNTFANRTPPKRLVPQRNQKQVSFGSAGKFVKSAFFERAGFFIKNVLTKVKEKGVDQNIANAINYGSKALISPLMILSVSPFTDEEEDSIKYSMVMQPIQAGLAFASSLLLSILANRAFDKAAKKGTLGNRIDPTLGKFFQNPEHLKQFKSMSTAVMTALVIPLTTAILLWSLPKIMKTLGKDEPPSSMVYSGLYAQPLNEASLFSRKLRPEFGMLTKKTE